MRHFILSALFCLFCLSALMAQPPGNWTADMSSSHIPSGVTLNDCDTLDDPVKVRFKISLDKTTYDNATASTAFNAIGDATETYILNTWLATQAIDTADISLYSIVIKNVFPGWDNYETLDPITQYYVAEDVYWITGLVKYLVE